MEKYKWSTSTIDELDFYLTLDLETGDWIREAEQNKQEPLVYIDQIPW